MDRDEIFAEDIAHEADEDVISFHVTPGEAELLAQEAEDAAAYYEAFVVEDYEPSPYDGTYSEM
jgi:hypothetical protein